MDDNQKVSQYLRDLYELGVCEEDLDRWDGWYSLIVFDSGDYVDCPELTGYAGAIVRDNDRFTYTLYKDKAELESSWDNLVHKPDEPNLEEDD